MNYGGIRLSEEYLQAAYKVCRATDTPVLCDEIQSCAWYDGLFLFRKYGLTPVSYTHLFITEAVKHETMHHMRVFGSDGKA